MAEILGGAGVPHSPHFPGIVQRQDALAAELRRLYGEIAGHLRQLDPDVLIFFTCDHYNNFFTRSLPIFSIGVADTASGPSDYPDLPRCDAVIDAPLAMRIQAHLVRAGFDVGMSQEFELDHPVTVPLQFLTPGASVPIVPVFIGGLMPPIPAAARCHSLGAAIRGAVEQSPEPRRVAAVASGSFSLDIGGPLISEDSHTGIPDPGWVERVLARLRKAEIAELVAEATEGQITGAGNAGGELLTWIAMLGTFDPSPPTFLESQPQFGHAFGAWLASERRP